MVWQRAGYTKRSVRFEIWEAIGTGRAFLMWHTSNSGT